LLVMGMESLVIDHAVLASDSKLVQKATAATEPVLDEWGFEIERKPAASAKTIRPPDWAPWSMLSSGAVIMLYALSSRIRGA